MELFNDVHPASLYTVMQLCKNDFVTCVSVLLSARRIKSTKNDDQKQNNSTIPSISGQKCQIRSRAATSKSSLNIQPMTPTGKISYTRTASIQKIAETVGILNFIMYLKCYKLVCSHLSINVIELITTLFLYLIKLLNIDVRHKCMKVKYVHVVNSFLFAIYI